MRRPMDTVTLVGLAILCLCCLIACVPERWKRRFTARRDWLRLHRAISRTTPRPAPCSVTTPPPRPLGPPAWTVLVRLKDGTLHPKTVPLPPVPPRAPTPADGLQAQLRDLSRLMAAGTPVEPVTAPENAAEAAAQADYLDSAVVCPYCMVVFGILPSEYQHRRRLACADHWLAFQHDYRLSRAALARTLNVERPHTGVFAHWTADEQN